MGDSNKPISYLNSPRNVAMDYLSRREHSRLELEQKLLQKGFEELAVAEALDQLVQENLLSDERFAQAYYRHRSSKGFGPLKIKAELQSKGLSSQIMHLAEQTEIEDWFVLLQRAASKKFGETVATNDKEKQKRLRFLQQRGFSMSDIMRLLR